MSDFNDQMVAEFRANGGRTERFGDAMLVVHSIGARSGETRLNPVAFQARGEDWAVFASAAGADRNPDWFHNLVAHPDVEIEVGDGTSVHTVPVHARVLDDAERAPIWERQKQLMPGFADYEAKTDRQIPVVLLTRR